jgi:hypothetical protein
MNKLSDFDSSLIRHDYKRAVYRAMLSELPPGEIIEFFHLTPLIVDGEQIQGKRLFDLIWAEKGKPGSIRNWNPCSILWIRGTWFSA